MRRIRSALVIAGLLAAMVGASAQQASASTYTEQTEFVRKINYSRDIRGYRTLRVRDDLTTVARRHARRMAERGSIYHNRYLGSQVTSDWKELGENVGRGSTVTRIHRAFMDSSGHRANILYSRWDSVGVGVAHAGGKIYVVEVFGNY